ncbi:unnamed protein product [Clonostachys byssicola]|uniref:Carrier domain-containing protein n=1 Tax=Clonostachys byssicola TaxID=160290 RepID=A0A9N9XU85_9HYPO|nr:unnamed protein product [Clonostachys byssicola]
MVLSQLTNRPDVCFGYLASGRDLVVDGVEEVIGPLITTLVSRVDLSGTTAKVLEETGRNLLNHFDFQHVSLAKIQDRLGLRGEQLFNTSMTIRQAIHDTSAGDGQLCLESVSGDSTNEYNIGVAVELNGAATDVQLLHHPDVVGGVLALEAAEIFQMAISFLMDGGLEHKEKSLYNGFFESQTGSDRHYVESVWREQLQKPDATTFPVLPNPVFTPKSDSLFTCDLAGIRTSGDEMEAISVLWTAWGLVTADYTRADDINFGAIISTPGGPSSPNSEAVAPTVPTTVPIHITINRDLRVQEMLEAVAATYIKIKRCGRITQHWVRQLNEGAKSPAFQSLLQIHQLEEGSSKIHTSMSELYSNIALRLLCEVRNNGLRLQIRFDSSLLEKIQIERLAHQFGGLVRQLGSDRQKSLRLSDIHTISEEDLTDIWSWNSRVPEPVEACVHDLFAATVAETPDRLAICAWDGDLTYKQLDILSSRLANYLVTSRGAGPGTIIPLCFEKSKWTPVAMLGVMKAGAASVAMDSSHPKDRLEILVQQAFEHSNRRLIISSRLNKELSHILVGDASDQATVIIAEDIAQEQMDVWRLDTVEVQPSDILYIAFTSGSTGIPKGAVISHRNFSSAIRHQQASFGFKSAHRVFDYISYAFNAAWFNLLHTLACGACLCIPSDSERKDDIISAMNRLRVTYTVVIPSLAKLIDPREVPSLQQAMFAGEPFNQANLQQWKGIVICNCYGCAECTVAASVGPITQDNAIDPGIGRGSGIVTWIVRPDGAALAAIGEVGELWLEGPLVGKGYLGNPEKTAQAFILDPPWLTRGGGNVAGRYGRLYRTGDLVQYNTNKTLRYVGRKDNQVKIRGQFVQLGDIEQQLRRFLDSNLDATVIVEVSQPSGSNTPLLVAFLSVGDVPDDDKGDADAVLSNLICHLDEKVSECLPAHMVPSAYVSLKEIPLTGTGKTDRRRLRDMVGKLTLEELAGLNPARAQGRHHPTTPDERRLRDLWASVLDIDGQSISTHDSFFKIGGDSVAAMRLIAAARDQGLAFSVADVFRRPHLKDLAEVISQAPVEIESIVPFSLMGASIDTKNLCARAAAHCQIPDDQVLDVFPCTQLQQGLLAMTAKLSSSYVARKIFRLDPSTEVSRFQNAWKQVVECYDILRTRVVSLTGTDLVQVVCAKAPEDHISDNLSEYLAMDRENHMGLGSALSYAAFIDDSESKNHYFVWTIHHALFDGLSLPLLLDAIVKNYNREQPPTTVPFQAFIKLNATLDLYDATEYWRSQFEGCEAQTFPSLPTPTHQPRANETIIQAFTNISWPQTNITPSNIVRSAWAILQGRHSNADDVVFGVVLSGRQASMAGIGSVMGPTIATVPIRILLNKSIQVNEFLQQVQSQSVDMLAYEQFGLSRIRGLGKLESEASDFQTLLIVQPGEDTKANGDQPRLFTEIDVDPATTVHQFNTSALTIICSLYDHGFDLVLSFDSDMLPVETANQMATQMEAVVQQLCDVHLCNRCISGIETTSMEELNTIWSWNASVPEPKEACVHELFSVIAKQRPHTLAIDAWDGNLTYRELDELSTTLAGHLIAQGAGPGTIIPLFFHKSKWVVVSIIGVMKAGCASVALDMGHPESRLRTIVQQACSNSKQRIILCSKSNEDLSRKLVRDFSDQTTVLVAEELVRDVIQTDALPETSPGDLLYVVFTSGTTGTPKGAMISHRNFSSAIHYQQSTLGITQSSRVFDFISYAFDVAWCNILQTITAGGCLCIPNESAMRNDIGKNLREMKISVAVLTPTIWSLVREHDISTLETAVFAGEKLLSEAARFQAVNRLNAYGPAECTVLSTIYEIKQNDTRHPSIGTGYGMVTWVVRADGSSLAAIGEVGELYLEGPLVGQGYLGELQKTDEVFIRNPAWLLKGGPGFSGRRGCLYRTGDLVRYNKDGTLDYIGRKDDQVKIRGQRVQLGDVEHHLQKCLGSRPDISVVAEVGQPCGSGTSLLFAFLAIGETAKGTGTELREAVATLRRFIDKQIVKLLPTYMIPTFYVPVVEIPIGGTGKADRRRLRDIVAGMTLEQLAYINPTRSREPFQEPLTDAELRLQRLWATVLGIETHTISTQDNFFQVGGDSVAAMRLVAAARDEGLSFSVADTFEHPKLQEMAGQISRVDTVHDAPKSWHPSASLNELSPTIHALYPNLDITMVQRTTDFQAQCIHSASSAPMGQTYHFFLDFADVKAERLEIACHRLWDAFDILRTVFVQIDDRYLQVVCGQLMLDISIHTVRSIVQESRNWCSADDAVLELGKSYVRMAIFQSPDGASRLAMRLCHAQYDGFMLQQIVRFLEADLNGTPTPMTTPFSEFIQHIEENREASGQYWGEVLDGSTVARLDQYPISAAETATITHEVMMEAPRSDATAANTFISVCALAISNLVGSRDLTVGLLVSGRAMIPRQMNIAGPCVNVIPLRVNLENCAEFNEVAQAVQKQRIASLAFEASQLGDIVTEPSARVSMGSLGFVLQFQNIEEYPEITVHGSSSKLEVFETGAAYDLPSISITARPVGPKWKVAFTASSRFYCRDSILRLSNSLGKILEEQTQSSC